MAPLADQLLFNAAAAALLAPIAYVSNWLNRPALTHTLWLLVLLRLIAPSVYWLPLPAWKSASADMPLPMMTEVAPSTLSVDDLIDWEFTGEATIEEHLPAIPPALPAKPPIQALDWNMLLVAFWAVCSVGWLAVSALRAGCFAVGLRKSFAADDRLSELVASLSRHLGLARPPRVIIVDTRMSPCVWAGLYSATLALPAGWLDGMSRLQQSAVLVHELAHLRRGDHWVRWFEAFVTALFWWHPVVWLARQEMREAEELCCDGWVVATLPAARRVYADALVDTLDFLATARPALPPLASGFGQVRELKRRIHMILKTNPVYRPGRAGVLMALGLGLFMPLGVARSDEGQSRPTTPKADDDRTTERRREAIEERERARTKEVRAREAEVQARDDEGRTRQGSDKNRDEVERIRDEMRKMQRSMDEMRAAMEKMRGRLAELGVEPGMPRAGGGREMPPEGGRGNADDKIRALKLDLEKLLTKYGDDHPDVRTTRRQIEEIRHHLEMRGEGRGDTPRPVKPVRPVENPKPQIGPGVPGFPGQPSAPRGGGDNDRRFDELARVLAELKREIAELKRDREREKDRDRRPPGNNN